MSPPGADPSDAVSAADDPGHVFVVHGDITAFACDAWLLPTDAHLYVTDAWWTPALADALRAAFCRNHHHHPGPAVPDAIGPERCRPVFTTDPPIPQPPPWLTVMGAGRVTFEWYLDGVRRFIAAALAELAHRPPFLARRARRLLAVPLVGTGHGGAHRAAGEMAGLLIEALTEEAARHRVDLALVCNKRGDFAAAQAARRNHGPGRWRALPSAAVERARALAREAGAGRLVVFLGAGVGAGAGLPLWDELLTALAERAGLDRAGAEWPHFQALDALDKAEYLAARLRDDGGVGPAVVELLTRHRHYGLAHALVAGLPGREAITTNYDRLYETACEATGRPCAVLPYEPDHTAPRWLLKMHGCVDWPDDIILTRENYLRYAERNAALAGIVQAMLITRSMLFLGFSLGDDNFLRIVDAVRRAIRPGGDRAGRLGTAVMLADNPLLRTLWGADLDWICLGTAGREAEAARRVEIFLDCLGLHAVDTAHLLDPRFAPVRTAAEDALVALLQPLRALPADHPAREAPAWALVSALLQRLGG